LADYEIVALLRPDLEEEAIEAAVTRIHQRVTEHGGTVKSTDRWGKRRLAYAIQKYRDGYYVLTVFSLDAPQVARFRQTLGLQEDILRFVVADHHAAPPRPAPAAAAASPAQTGAPSGPAMPPAAGPSVTPVAAPAGVSSGGGSGPSSTSGGEGTDV
jgi:small subunit ribosomal protein S6